MSFPANYPNSPPSVKFISEMWHPNGKHRIILYANSYLLIVDLFITKTHTSVYPDGRVCISILHAPGDDPNGYELASEQWTPVHTVFSHN